MRATLLHLLALACLAGCGGGSLATYPVTGRIAFPDGRPLKGGSVIFQPVVQPAQGPDGKVDPTKRISARGAIQSDGSYELSTFTPGDGAIAGKHRVMIAPPLPPGPIDPMNPSKPVIHDRYLRFETSGLEYEVKKDGANTFDIRVDPPAPRR